MAEKLPEAEKGRKITVKIIKPQSSFNCKSFTILDLIFPLASQNGLGIPYQKYIAPSPSSLAQYYSLEELNCA
jgi:hypothetical protein